MSHSHSHKFDPGKVDRLESRERYEAMPPERLLRRLGLKRGMVFVDVGAGSGFFSLPASGLVGPEGRVHALDVEPVMLDHLKAKDPPGWLERHVMEDGAIPLADSSADFVFSCFVLHETPDPVRFIREMGRVAKSYAPVIIVDWAKVEQEEGPPFEIRNHHHDVESFFLEAGLCYRSTELYNPSQYVVTGFRKRTG